MPWRIVSCSCVLFLLLQGCTSRKEAEYDSLLRSDGMVLHSESSGKVYLVSGGQRHWVPGPAVAEALGIVCLIGNQDDSSIDAIPLGPDMPALATKVVQNAKTTEVFLLQCGKRRYVPDPQTIAALNLGPDIRQLPPEQIQLIPLGPPLPHAAPRP
jgi:hypothetical protein